MTTVKAISAPVQIGNLIIEGLMFEDGTFGIAIPQIHDQLVQIGTSRNQASKDIKRLLGKAFRTSNEIGEGKTARKFTHRVKTQPVDLESIIIRTKVEGYNQAISAIDITNLRLLLQAAANAGYQDAIDLLDGLLDVSFYQLWCDAFDIKFEVEERQAFLRERLDGIFERRSETDAIQEVLIRSGVPKEFHKEIYAQTTNITYLHLFGLTAKQIKQALGIRDTPRNYCTPEQLRAIGEIENRIVEAIELDGLEAIAAAHYACERKPRLKLRYLFDFQKQ